MSVSVNNIISTHIRAPHVLAAVTILEWQLFEGGEYSRVASNKKKLHVYFLVMGYIELATTARTASLYRGYSMPEQ